MPYGQQPHSLAKSDAAHYLIACVHWWDSASHARTMTPKRAETTKRGNAAADSTVYVALLRGINVGGNNMVNMKALKASFEQLGLEQVSTYINSGNVLFRSPETDPRKLEATIDAMLARDYGLKGGTVVRSFQEMSRLKKNIGTHWKESRTDWRYNVIFLRHSIDSKTLLDGVTVQPALEQVVYCPGTLLWCAKIDEANRGGMLKLSKKSVDREMTVRNLNTTNKLIALMEQMEKVG
jgi:uncharacterized protein (DUF1697 family)